MGELLAALAIAAGGMAVGWALARTPKTVPAIPIPKKSVVEAIEELTEAVVGLQLIIWGQKNPGVSNMGVSSMVTIDQVKAEYARKEAARKQEEAERAAARSAPELE